MITVEDMERFAATFLGEAVKHWREREDDDECEICLLLISVSIALRINLSKVSQYLEVMDAEAESERAQ